MKEDVNPVMVRREDHRTKGVCKADDTQGIDDLSGVSFSAIGPHIEYPVCAEGHESRIPMV